MIRTRELTHDEAEQAVHLQRELLLAAVAHEGPTAAARVCHDALRGEPAAAGLPLAALLRALPTVSWLTAHDILKVTRADEDTELGSLNPYQRTALAAALAHVPAS